MKSTSMKIPFSPPYIDQAVIDQVMDTLKSNWITSGPKVKALEEEIMTFTNSKAAICVNSWTSGAILMLKWLGVKEGDEVIVPAYTYCATALAVLHCGATPIMVDIKDDLTIDPQDVRKAITSKTKAIIAVDIAGWPCDYKALNSIINDPEIKSLFVAGCNTQAMLGRILLMSDAAHSIGAQYDKQAAVLQSDIAIFSFHAVKNITTAEGGCICLNLPEIFDTQKEYKYLKIFSLNGQNKDAFSKSTGGGWKYDILYKGLKINMPDICAAIGLGQIKQYTNHLLPLRKMIALIYDARFRAYDWFIPPTLHDGERESSYHLYPIRIKNITEFQRDQIIDQLTEKGIVVNVHFIPMPMLTLFKSLGYSIQNYPNAYRQYACEISLPIYPQLSDEEINYIIDSVIECVRLQTEVPVLVKVAS